MENQIARITAMENKLNQVLGVLNKEIVTLAELSEIQPIVAELSHYYSSPQWKEDFEADEKGLLPKTLKRGVLSEDGIYNMLLRNRELLFEYNGGALE